MATRNTTSNNIDFKLMLSQVETTLNEYFVKKVPGLPANVKNILVTITPWFTLIGVLLTLPLLLGAIGLSAVMPFMAPPEAYHPGVITLVFILISVVLEAIALPGLFKRQRQGWEYLFYSNLVGVIGTLLAFSIGGLLGLLISFYILFQIREYYK